MSDRSRQVVGVGAGPESHGREVNGFVGFRMGRYIVEEAVSGGKVKLGGVGLAGGQLAQRLGVRMERTRARA